MPYDIGEPIIVAVSGQQGIVTFTGQHGERGTFDLAAKTWTFDAVTLPPSATVISVTATVRPLSAP